MAETMASPPSVPNSSSDSCSVIYYSGPAISLDSFFQVLILLYIYSASAILLFLSVYHVRVAVSRRLWLFPSHPSKLFALNAGTSALLSIAVKPPNDTTYNGTDEISKLLGTVFICTLLGACMPSIATTDMDDMWSNIAGVTMLVITVFVNIYLQLTHNIIHDLVFEHSMVIIFMGMLLIVLWTQALALEAMMSDISAMVSDQLEEIRTEVRPGFRNGVVQQKPWTWNAVERESHIKLMMVLTSNPQNVMARSPSAAVVGALVLCSVLMMVKALLHALKTSSYYNLIGNPILAVLQGPTIVLCGFICVWRWLRVALHEDRPFLSLLLDAEPLYWRRKLRTLRHKLRAGPHERQPNVLEEGQYGFKEALHYTADFLLLLTIVPIQRILIAVTRILHVLSASLMQLLVWTFKVVSAYMCGVSTRVSAEMDAATSSSVVHESATTSSSIVLESAPTSSSMSVLNESQGAICLAGEDASIVRREFQKAVTSVAQKRINRNMDQLITLLIRASTSCNIGGISRALDQRGAPDVKNLHVEHGYQYGWSLTLVSLLAVLTRLEIQTLGRSEASEAAMITYWQAQEMVKVVDEQYTPIVCSKETYVAASALVWSKLRKKKRRWSQKRDRWGSDPYNLRDPGDILKALQAELPGQRHIKEFNEGKRNVVAAWQEDTVMFYTMHTLCENLLKCWMDAENRASINASGDSNAVNAEMLVEYVTFLFAEILAGCLSNLPIALSTCTTVAVRDGHTHMVENGILLVAQGKQLWEKLQWPSPCAQAKYTFGQLCQWF